MGNSRYQISDIEFPMEGRTNGCAIWAVANSHRASGLSNSDCRQTLVQIRPSAFDFTVFAQVIASVLRAMSNAARGRAMRRAFWRSAASCVASARRRSSLNASVAVMLILMAAPFSSR